MSPLLALSTPGWPEILFILLIILVLFGAKRLPELARGLGQSLNEFRKAREELDREIKKTATVLETKEAPDKEPHKPA
ncbi:MAG: twin-arginine translocase TatA/TatE family subunit [Chthoniobacterales bacterium]|jgi:sec-independent protein translocase protein TatA|nr:twin-arginine translocase TatA/TatE family subunit [Chthoniobacterales bacterium]